MVWSLGELWRMSYTPELASHPNTTEKHFHTQPNSHCLQTPRGYNLPEALRLPAPAQRWAWKKIAGASDRSKAQRNCDMSAEARKRDPRALSEALRVSAIPRYVESTMFESLKKSFSRYPKNRVTDRGQVNFHTNFRVLGSARKSSHEKEKCPDF